MDESELSRLRDRLDIAEVMTRYATGVDNRDGALLRRCFAQEVEIAASSSGRLHELFVKTEFARGLKMSGDQWVNQLVQGMSALAVTQHMIGNHLIEFSANEAVCTAYLRAMHFAGAQFPGSPPYEVGGYYRNTLIRTPEGWRIRRWTLTCTWETGDATVLVR
jgi:hypothetical protein